MIIIRIIKIYKVTKGCGSRTIHGLTYRELNIEAI